MSQLLTIPDTAAQLAVHPITVRRLIARGELHAVHIGRAVRIDQLELERLINRGRPRRPAQAAETTKLTSGQQRALHAKAGELDKRWEQSRGSSKRIALEAASTHFQRPISSFRGISDDQPFGLDEDTASWILDWLDEALETG